MSTTCLAPGLLLAAPRLGDPNFERTVVLMGHHDASGALGWVLNGRALAPVRQLLQEASLVPTGVTLPSTPPYEAAARVGGPVMPGSAWLLFEREPELPAYEGQRDLGCGFVTTATREAIEAVARGQGPKHFRLLLGYAGWGPGQVEGEIRLGAWLPASLDASLLRGHDVDGLWDAAYRRAGTSPIAFTSTQRGSA